MTLILGCLEGATLFQYKILLTFTMSANCKKKTSEDADIIRKDLNDL